jgi:hypothetical protein
MAALQRFLLKGRSVGRVFLPLPTVGPKVQRQQLLRVAQYSSSSSTTTTQGTFIPQQKQGLSTEAALKLKKGRGSHDELALVDLDEEEHLARIGMTREKIEVDGMKLNWDKMGKGDHVVLLLPGIIGTVLL